MHVYHVPIIDPHTPPDMMERMVADGEAAAMEQYDAFRESLSGQQSGACTFSLRIGFAIKEILDLAAEMQPAYIVMGTHGASGIRKLIGSNTSSVIEKATMPVIAVPDGAQFHPLQHIVYATDLLADDYRYIDQLLQLAGAFDARVSCLHVCRYDHEPDTIRLEEIREFFWEEGKKDKLSIEIIRSDDVMEGLEQYITEQGADMVAMLTRHRSIWNKLFSTSMTRKMAYHTNVPLLAFHT